MKYRNEIKNGYFWSFLSPLIITFLFSIYSGVITAIEKPILDAIGAFFSVLAIFGFFSILFSGLFCAIIGIPAYYLLKSIGFTNWAGITVIGGLVAYLYAITENHNMYFQGLYVAYGLCSGFFFWWGSTKHASKL